MCIRNAYYTHAALIAANLRAAPNKGFNRTPESSTAAKPIKPGGGAG